MKLLETNNNFIKLELLFNEFLIITNSLNEICNGLPIANVEAVTGVPEIKLTEMLSQFGIVMTKISNQIRSKESETNNFDEITEVIELNKIELEIISKVLNEVARRIEPWEYQTRIGMMTQDALELNDTIIKTLERLP